MEIHKPKAAHSVREFLIEIGTIICGILIALALEQGVEWLHWREQVHLTEEALQPEIQHNLRNIAERISLRPCLVNEIVTLRDALLAPGEHWRAPPRPERVNIPNPGLADIAAGAWIRPDGDRPMPPVYHAPHRPWFDTAYRTALAAGVLNHMPGDRARVYGDLYYEFSILRDNQEAEFTKIPHLARLGFDGSLSGQERSSYVNTIAELESIEAIMVNAGAQVVIEADKAGIRAKRSDLQKLSRRSTCRANIVFPADN